MKTVTPRTRSEMDRAIFLVRDAVAGWQALHGRMHEQLGLLAEQLDLLAEVLDGVESEA